MQTHEEEMDVHWSKGNRGKVRDLAPYRLYMILNSLLFALQCTVACSWAFPLFACSSGGRPEAKQGWAQQLKVGYRIVL